MHKTNWTKTKTVELEKLLTNTGQLQVLENAGR